MVGTAPTLDGVTYRQQTEAPTERGYFYGEKFVTEHKANIVPMFVFPEDGVWYCDYMGIDIRVDTLRWFGPVMTCREG